MTAFQLSVDQLRARRSTKWSRYPADVLPAWVADMDFTVPDAVQQAMVEMVEHRAYGYGVGHGLRLGEDGLAAAFAYRMASCFDWQVDPALVQPTSELIQALFSIAMAFSEPGDGVVVQSPIYPPFLMTVAQTGRSLVDNPLIDTGSRLEMDLAGLRRAMDSRTKLLFLCNPHNPTGRVFERAELEALAEIVLERNLIVVSDEIHGDLIYDGRRHIPFASLSPEIAARTITATSATKSFNIPGLRCALMYFGTPELQQRFFRVIPDRLLGQISVPGIDATVAAWRHGQPWLEEVKSALATNRQRLAEFMAQELPEIKHYSPEGTYLAWLDCRALDLKPSPYTFFLEQAKVGLNDGGEFGTNGATCARLNFATSPAILDEVLERMRWAVREWRGAPA